MTARSAWPPPSISGPCSGAALSLLLLDKELFAPDLGWRLAFGPGAVLGYNAVFFTQAQVLSTFFYAVGTGIGGVTGPALFGKLVETGKEVNVFYGYLIGAALMIAAGVAEWFIGIEAAGRSLEDVARPLTAHDEEAEATS